MSYADIFLQEFSREEAVASVASIIRPNLLRMRLPNAQSIQESMPEVLQTKWSKLLEDVDKSSAILTTLHKALFRQDNSGIAELTSLSLSSTLTPAKVVMIFGAFRNRQQHGKYCKHLRSDLGEGFIVIKLNGEVTSNREAELNVKTQVAKAQRQGKKVVIVSKDMASRSFSISEIDTVFLMYDGGLLSQTIQKASRAYTPGQTFLGEDKKVGTVVSLSFDANREEVDPIDLYVINEATRIAEEEESLQASIRRICQSVNIFENDLALGTLQVDADLYAENLLGQSSILKEAAACLSLEGTNVSKYVNGLIANRSSKSSSKSSDNVEVDITKAQSAIVDGKETSGKANDPKQEKQLIKNVLYMVNNITALSDIEGYTATDLISILESIELQGLEEEVEYIYGLTFSVITQLVEDQVLPIRVLNTILDGYEIEPFEI